MQQRERDSSPFDCELSIFLQSLVFHLQLPEFQIRSRDNIILPITTFRLSQFCARFFFFFFGFVLCLLLDEDVMFC